MSNSTSDDFEREAREWLSRGYLEKDFAGSVVTELARLLRRLADRGEDRGWNAALAAVASKTKNLSGFGHYVALEDVHTLKR